MKKIVIGADHRGFALKEQIKMTLARNKDYEIDDVGCFSETSCDYPDYAREVAKKIQNGQAQWGILICKTGIGMSIAANRFKGIRAALCLTPEVARQARRHNDANVLVLASQSTTPQDALKIIDAWNSEIFEGGRHLRRIQKIDELSTNG